MRCIGNEGVPVALSRLALCPPSHLSINPGHNDATVTSTVSDITIPTGPVRAFPIDGLQSHALSDSTSSPSSSPQLSPMSTRSDSDFAQSDSPVVKDLPTMSSPVSSRSVQPQKFPASASSPELNSILPENYAASKRRSPSGFSSTTSSDSPESSCTSTARNSPSRNGSPSSSSSRTIPDDVYPRAISSSADLSVSDTQLLGRTSRAKAPARKLSEGRTDGIVSDLLKRYHHRSADTVLNRPAKNGEGAKDQEKNLPAAVQLPERYRHVLKKSGSYGNIGNVSSRKSSSSSEQGQDLTSREKDLGTALAWIRHEMVQMKEQDKVLLKRFIELRATILQLRCNYGSASDICSMDGSNASLNYEVPRSRSRRMRNAGSDAMLAGTMYTSSLSLPCSPQLSRLRWGSDELM